MKRHLQLLFQDRPRAYAVLAIVLGQIAAYTSAYLAPSEMERWICLAFFFPFNLAFIGYLRSGDIKHYTLRFGMLGMFYGFFLAWLEGGIWSSSVGWFLMLPVGVHYMLGARTGFFVMLGSVGLLTGLMVLSFFGWQLDADADALSSPWLPLMSVSDHLMVILLIYGIPWMYEKTMKERVQALHLQKQALETKQHELEHAQSQRDHFIASISHELRTPMNAILGLNQVLMQRIQHKPEAIKVLRYTQRSADHLMTVINDVLDYSQFASGKLNVHAERTDLREVVQAAYQLFVPRTQVLQLDYHCTIADTVPQWLHTDRHRLMQILVNLLGNAIKFTSHGSVHLQVSLGAQGVEFAVQDTGIGIASDKLETIFERYTQEDAHTQSRFGGTGLGLTISRTLVTLLGGQLQVRSTLGQGSRFWFDLPLQGAASAHAVANGMANAADSAASPAAKPDRTATPVLPTVATQPHAASGVPTLSLPAAQMAQTAQAMQTTSAPAWDLTEKNLRFLVVDDHAVNRRLIKLVLSQQCPHCLIVEAEDGEQALQRIAEQDFDLIIMDMVMPRLDGIEATARIRASHELRVRQLPVLGLTANVTQNDLARFEQAGASDIMLKPFQVDRLLASLQRLLDAVPAQP